MSKDQQSMDKQALLDLAYEHGYQRGVQEYAMQLLPPTLLRAVTPEQWLGSGLIKCLLLCCPIIVKGQAKSV